MPDMLGASNIVLFLSHPYRVCASGLFNVAPNREVSELVYGVFLIDWTKACARASMSGVRLTNSFLTDTWREPDKEMRSARGRS